MKKLNLLCALVAGLTVAGPAVAQQTNVFFPDKTYCLEIDGQGNLWVGWQQGLAVAPAGTDNFDDFEMVWTDRPIYDLHLKNDTLWAATNQGVYFAQIAEEPALEFLPGLTSAINKIQVINNQHLFVASISGVHEYRQGNWTYFPEVASVNTIFLDSRDTLWVASSTKGIVTFNNGNWVDKNGTKPDLKAGLRGVGCLAEDSNGEIWAGSSEFLRNYRAGEWTYGRQDLPLLDYGQALCWAMLFDGPYFYLFNYNGLFESNGYSWQKKSLNGSISGKEDMEKFGDTVFIMFYDGGGFSAYYLPHQNTNSISITDAANTITTCSIQWQAQVKKFKEFRLEFKRNDGYFQPCPNLEQGPDYGKPLVITDPSVASFTFDYFNPVKDSTITLKIVALSTDGNVVSAEQSFIIPRTVGYDTGGENPTHASACYAANDFLANLMVFASKVKIKTIIFNGDTELHDDNPQYNYYDTVVVEIREKNKPNEQGLRLETTLVYNSGPQPRSPWREVNLDGFGVELEAGEYFIGFSSNGTGKITVNGFDESLGHGYYMDYWHQNLIPSGSDYSPLIPQYDFLIRLEVVVLSSVEERGFNPVPQDFALEQNFPNPFNPQTTISYSLAKPGNIKLIIYNILGREVETLINEQQLPGAYYLRWVADENLPAGIYFCRLQADNFVQTKKMTLMK
jgi:hypothetical protein